MSNKRSTYQPTYRQRIIRAVCIGVVCGSVVGGAGVAGAAWQHSVDAAPVANTAYGNVLHIQPCIEEDSRNCVWDAGKTGNGKGTSFIDYNGEAYYRSE